MNSSEWMRILSHEVGHLPHYEKSWSLVTYVIGFGLEYLMHGGHDFSPREIEADNGQVLFDAFESFVNSNVEQEVVTVGVVNG